MGASLTTTNVFLGIMAAVSLLEVAVVIALFAAAFLAYRRIMHAIDRLEAEHVAPAAARVNDILDNVKSVTSLVNLFKCRRA